MMIEVHEIMREERESKPPTLIYQGFPQGWRRNDAGRVQGFTGVQVLFPLRRDDAPQKYANAGDPYSARVSRRWQKF